MISVAVVVMGSLFRLGQTHLLRERVGPVFTALLWLGYCGALSQNFLTGQSAHCGETGRQRVWPNDTM